MLRRSAPFTVASGGSTAFVRGEAVFRRGDAFRVVFLAACFREVFVFVIVDISGL